MEYRKLKDDEDIIDRDVEVAANVDKSFLISAVPSPSDGETKIDTHRTKAQWKRKSVVTCALTILTSSQAILIVWSKRAGKYEYSVTTANFLVETLKCAISLVALARSWMIEGVTENNRLTTTLDEVIVYPIPAAPYLVKNLLQYYIFAYVDAPTRLSDIKELQYYQYRCPIQIILKKKLSEIQWAAFVLLTAGCTTAQLNSNSDHVLQTPVQGWVMAIVMALLGGFAGVYTEAIIKKRNINVQNFWLYIFGMGFNIVAILVQDFDAVVNKGFFHGYSFITFLMIFNHALSGIAVSMVMKYADNIVKVNGDTLFMTVNFKEFKVESQENNTWDENNVMTSTADYLAGIDSESQAGLIDINDSSDLQLAIALQQEFEQQPPPRHNQQPPSNSGSSRLVTGPQVARSTGRTRSSSPKPDGRVSEGEVFDPAMEYDEEMSMFFPSSATFGSVSEGETFDPAIYDEEMSMFFPSSDTLGTPAMEYVEEMSSSYAEKLLDSPLKVTTSICYDKILAELQKAVQDVAAAGNNKNEGRPEDYMDSKSEINKSKRAKLYD